MKRLCFIACKGTKKFAFTTPLLCFFKHNTPLSQIATMYSVEGLENSAKDAHAE